MRSVLACVIITHTHTHTRVSLQNLTQLNNVHEARMKIGAVGRRATFVRSVSLPIRRPCTHMIWILYHIFNS